MYTDEDAVKDLASVIAQQVSGVRDANPDQGDFELAADFVKIINNYY